MSLSPRLLPYLWPSRHKILLSFVFATLVAILWGGNLSIVFPVVKILMEKQSLTEYVSESTDEARRDVQGLQQELTELEKKYINPPNEREALEFLQKKASFEAKISSASHRVAMWQWINLYVIRHLPKDKFDTLALILGFLLVLTVVKLLCMLAEDMLVGSVAQLTVIRLRSHLFRKTLALDYQTLTQLGTPNLMSRFTYDLETLTNGLSLLGGKVIREPLKAIACIVFAFWWNWRLTLMSLLLVPLAMFVFYRIGRTLKRASHLSMECMSRIYGVLEETFDSLKVVIAFNGVRRHRLHHHIQNKNYYEKSMRIVFIDAITSPVTELFGLLAVLVAILPGAYLVLRGTTSIWGIRLAATQMDIAELSVLYALLAGILDPVRKLSSVFSKLKRSTAAAERVFELMDRQSQVVDAPKPKPMPKGVKSIEFQQVRFTYATEQHIRPQALDSVSLTVNTGEVVAVVGENGSGKSTLVNLLPRYYDPSSGQVLFDGINIRDFGLADLRQQIGVVTQETLLFDDTIYENIRYGDSSASREQVEQAAKQAHVTQFLELLPEGFETRVGARGASLSGGQRQRISLARAILRNPSVLILDEATSAIDAQSEVLIHRALQQFVKGRTTFIITHSVTASILELVTKIVVMERGKISAVGTHEELLKTCPLYDRLCHARSSRAAA